MLTAEGVEPPGKVKRVGRNFVKDGASSYRDIFAQVMTMGGKHILARVIGIQKEKFG